MIAIVDYGAGNVSSVKKAFEHLGASVQVTSDPEVVRAALCGHAVALRRQHGSAGYAGRSHVFRIVFALSRNGQIATCRLEPD